MSKNDFEDNVWRKVKADMRGWELERVTAFSGPSHFKASRGKKIVLFYSISSRALLYSDIENIIEQVMDYRREDNVTTAIVYTAKDTIVRHPVQSRADIYEIKIKQVQ